MSNEGGMSYSDEDIGILASSVKNKYESSRNEAVHYKDYLDILLDRGSDKVNFPDFVGGNAKSMKTYPYTARIAPSIAEMVELYNENFDDIFEAIKDVPDETTRSEIRKSMFKEILKPKYTIEVKEPFKGNMWFGDSTHGVNVRPGLVEGDTKRPVPLVLADDIVHGLIVGITGSGKSVLMNSVAMNWLWEYAPWEINIYMGDFKKVELSRYGNIFKTPHVKVIAATDSPSYVVSLFKFLEEEMNAAKQLFSEFGIQNIQGFRKEFGLVLARNVALVDEFTQAFEKANASELIELEKSIQAVAKLGRSMGYHLIFGSQTMSGTVSASVLNQFGLGIALNSDEATSNLGIGNSGAVGLMSRGKGWCVANPMRSNGSKDNNVVVRVPYLDPETKGEGGSLNIFYSLLKEVSEMSANVGFKPELKFYNESSLRAYRALKEDLVKHKEEFEAYTENKRKDNVKVLTKIILGDTTRYLGSGSSELETFDWVCNRDRNLFVHSKSEGEIRYMLLLLTANFRAHNFAHKVFVGDIELYNLLKVGEYLPNVTVDISEEFDLAGYEGMLNGRQILKRYMNYSTMLGEHNQKIFCKWYSEKIVNQGSQKIVKEYDYEITRLISDIKDGSIETSTAEIEAELFGMMRSYNAHETWRGNKPFLSIFDFPVNFVWMFAPNSLVNCYRRGNMLQGCQSVFEECSAHGIYFIFVTRKYSSVKDIANACSYFLVSNPEDKIYGIEDFNMINPVEGANIRIFDKTNVDKTNFNFKKYQVTNRVYKEPF